MMIRKSYDKNQIPKTYKLYLLKISLAQNTLGPNVFFGPEMSAILESGSFHILWSKYAEYELGRENTQSGVDSTKFWQITTLPD